MRFILFVLALSFFSPANLLAGGRLEKILSEATKEGGCHYTLESLSLESVHHADPDLTIKTDRFTVRPLTTADLNSVWPIFQNKQVREMSGDHLSEGSLRGLLSIGSDNPGKHLHPGTIINFGIFEGDKLIGMSQIANTYPTEAIQKGIAKQGETWAEVSYHLDPAYWGKGVAPEVALKTTAMAFDKYKVDGIHGHTIPSNDASGKVLMKLGMDLIHTDAEGKAYAARRDKALANRVQKAQQSNGPAKNTAVEPQIPRQVVSNNRTIGSEKTHEKLQEARGFELPPAAKIEALVRILKADHDIDNKLTGNDLRKIAENILRENNKEIRQILGEYWYGH